MFRGLPAAHIASPAIKFTNSAAAQTIDERRVRGILGNAADSCMKQLRREKMLTLRRKLSGRGDLGRPAYRFVVAILYSGKATCAANTRPSPSRAPTDQHRTQPETPTIVTSQLADRAHRNVDMLEPIPNLVWQEILRPANATPEEECKSGLSQSRVVRCHSPSGPLCLRGWPATVSRKHLDFIFEAINVARQAGIETVPRYIHPQAISGWVEADNRLWELTEWKLGTADFSAQPTSSRLAAATSCLGNLHRIWRHWRSGTASSPGVVRRLQIVNRLLNTNLTRRWLDSVHTGLFANRASELEFMARRTIRAFEAHGTAVRQSLAALLAVPVPVHPVLRDVHVEHVLFAGDQVSGIIDFGALAIDEPVVDLVRLLASCRPDRRDWLAAIAAYEQASGVVVDQRRLAVLDQASCLLSAVQWAEWLLFQGLQFDTPLGRLIDRWKKLVERLEELDWQKPPQ
ncbi:MAG: aminoglycoside phosphotransferase family protein [Planctomycetota bacterium]|nr:MAG: aminoglycoside phosphotransferase family protein [Planctomycetota bacterium]